MAKKQWRNVTIPFEMFEMTTERAIIFRFRDGVYKDYSFVRPNKTVRSDRDGFKGFVLGYSVEQSLDANGDVVSETPELLNIKKSERDSSGKWSVVEEEEITMDLIESLI